MIQPKTLAVLPIGVLAIFVVVGCGTQSAPVTVAVQMLPTQTEVAPTQTAKPSPTTAPTETPTEAPTAAPSESAAVSFASDVFPIIESRCVNCHGGERVEEGLLLRSYDEIMAGSDNGQVIVPGDAANSLLVQLVTENKMPKRGPKLTPVQVQTITDWVNLGAQNN